MLTSDWWALKVTQDDSRFKVLSTDEIICGIVNAGNIISEEFHISKRVIRRRAETISRWNNKLIDRKLIGNYIRNKYTVWVTFQAKMAMLPLAY